MKTMKNKSTALALPERPLAGLKVVGGLRHVFRSQGLQKLFWCVCGLSALLLAFFAAVITLTILILAHLGLKLARTKKGGK